MIASFVPVPAEGGFNPLDVNTGSFFWTLVIFVIALPFMWKVVFGPITAALYARDAQASEAAQAAQKARDEAAEDRARVEVALGEAQAEAARQLAAARERAEARERDIVENAKREAGAMIEGARTQIRAEQEKALASIRAEVVDLSIAAASKVIARNVGSEDDRRLVQEMVSDSKESK
ncbi:MAG: F0F1 ATP synthase subunit B [Planctomycetota bacterium]|nr:F0F1 ATP synthase subunit B [Planctomycetota bacterium]